MSEQQPTGVTVYYDGSSANFPTATGFHVDPNTGALYVERRPNPGDLFATPGNKNVATYRRWDSAEIHEPKRNVVIVDVDGQKYEARLTCK